MLPTILVLGAGYGGLTTTLHLQKELNYNEANVILVNRHHYHYISTHLHQSAAGTINSKQVKIDLDELINQEKVNFIKAEIKAIELAENKVILGNQDVLNYDFLVIALGSEVETFGIKGLREYAYTIRSINTVQLIKEHIDYMFAKYKAEEAKPEYLTFVVGGAGFTGIEFVGELADKIPELCKQFDVKHDKVRIINIEAASSPLPGFDPKLVEYAIEVLKEKGVEFRMNMPIQECNEEGVILKSGEVIKAATVVWTGGVKGNKIIEKIGLEHIRGRVKIDPFLRAPGYENIFVIGDNSIVYDEEEKPYPASAQMAVQQGEHVAKQIISTIRNDEYVLREFKFNNKGTIASLGKSAAIGRIGKWKLSGLSASFLKHMIDNRYLYSIGGLPLVLKKGKIIG